MSSKFSPSITIPTVANTAPVISRFGSDDVFVELSFRSLGETIELVATKVEYTDMTGRYARTEIGREIIGREDAVNAACDLEWMAVEALEGIDGYADPVGFGEAVEKAVEDVLEDVVEEELDAFTYAIAAE